MKHTFTFVFILLCLATSYSRVTNSETNSLSPEIHAPDDVVVSCMYWFSLRSLDDPTDATFGRMVYGQANIQKLKTIDKVCASWCEYDSYTGYDPDVETDGDACYFYRRNYNPSHPDNKYALVWGWDGWVTNATSAVEIRVDDRRECGIGLIIRTFTVVDRGVVFSDKQRIWVIDCDPFYVSDDCTDPDDDVEWPLFCQQPDALDGCYADLSPSNPQLGRPRIVNGADDQCNLISVDFKDDTITVEAGACLKVLRTWSVIDWCQYHPLRNPNRGRWDYLQVIKVRDKLDPVMTCQIGECTPAFRDSAQAKCRGYIELRAHAVDSCTVTDHLRYEYKIDLFNDGQGQFGEFDLHVGPLAKLSESPAIQENDYAEFADSVLNASGTYPIGEHRIKWFVEDGCGNVALCDTTFIIKDCKAPTPYCKTGIVTVVMPSVLMIDVWASDLNAGSYDNCSDDLIYSFSSDTSEQSKTFTCDDLGIQQVEIWVTDEEGNQDYCVTEIEIQDNLKNCPNTIITGQVVGNLPMEWQPNSAQAQLLDRGVVIQTKDIFSDKFSFDITGLAGPALRVVYDKNPLNGVTVSDAIAIQRHLLGIDEFQDDEIYTAADVNGNCSITASDIAVLFKTMLGKQEDFSKYGVPSYRFIPVGGTIDCDPNGGFAIDTTDIQPVYQFKPLKMGDVR